MPTPTRLKRVYWDANVTLSYINGVLDRLETIDRLLDAAAGGALEIDTSVLSVAEVAFSEAEKHQLALSADAMGWIEDFWDSGVVKLAEVHELVVLDARDLTRKAMEKKWRLTTVDGVHLATAARLQVDAVHTYDEKLYRFAELIRIPIGPPDLLFYPGAGATPGGQTSMLPVLTAAGAPDQAPAT